MSFFDIATTVVGGVFSGGATGLIGIGLQRFFDYKQKRLDVETLKLNLESAERIRQSELLSDERMAQLKLAVADREAAAAEHRADMDYYARDAEAKSREMMALIASDKSTYLDPKAQLGKGWVAATLRLMMGLVDFLRGAFRPVAASYLLGLCTMLWMWLQELAARMQVVLSAAQVYDLMLQLLSTLTYVTITALVWFYGSRPAQPVKSK